MLRNLLLLGTLSFLTSVALAHGDWEKVLSDVQTKISADRDLAPYEITTSYYQGVVTLNGTVKSETARNDMISLTSEVKGVDRVINQLVVDESLSMQPVDPGYMAKPKLRGEAEVVADVRQALEVANIDDVDRLQLSYDSRGELRLEGDRDTFREIDHILSVALMVPGVESLDNRMTIDGQRYSDVVKQAR